MAAASGQDTPGEGNEPQRPLPPRPELELPAVLAQALAAAPEARERFEQLSWSHRREYVRWVAEARRDDTRARRAAQTVMRLLERR